MSVPEGECSIPYSSLLIRSTCLSSFSIFYLLFSIFYFYFICIDTVASPYECSWGGVQYSLQLPPHLLDWIELLFYFLSSIFYFLFYIFYFICIDMVSSPYKCFYFYFYFALTRFLLHKNSRKPYHTNYIYIVLPYMG